MAHGFRVSRLLAVSGLVDSWWFTPEARARGTAVHDIAESIFLGHPISVAAVYAGYRQALAEAVATLEFEALCVEQRLHGRDGTNGRPDAVGLMRRPCGRLREGPTIIDVKTGDRAPAHGVQLAFYARLADASDIRDKLPSTMAAWPWQRVGLYVQPSGRYHLHVYDEQSDFFITDAITDIVRWRIAHELLDPADVSLIDDPFSARELA